MGDHSESWHRQRCASIGEASLRLLSVSRVLCLCLPGSWVRWGGLWWFLVTHLRIYGFTDPPPSLPVPRPGRETPIRESSVGDMVALDQEETSGDMVPIRVTPTVVDFHAACFRRPVHFLSPHFHNRETRTPHLHTRGEVYFRSTLGSGSFSCEDSILLLSAVPVPRSSP